MQARLPLILFRDEVIQIVRQIRLIIMNRGEKPA
jgi:hypothetical protein